jgi:glycosyltransferase involved in cell wall biosynthesis
MIHEVSTIDMAPQFARRVAPLRAIDRIRPYRYGLWSLAVAEKLATIDGDFDAVEFIDCQAESFVALRSRACRERIGTAPRLISACGPMWVVEQLSVFESARVGREIYHQWEQAALAAADGILAPSWRCRDAIGAPSNAAVVPQPVLSQPSRSRTVDRDELVLLIGAAEPNKGADVWARSLNIVLRDRRSARAMLIGPDTPTGPDGTSMVAHLRALIDADLRDRFQWVGPLLFNEVSAYMDRAALVVVPSRFESFSYVAADALMNGVPVLMSDGVGLAEHAPSAPTIRAGDADALAEGQLKILENIPAASEWAAATRREIIESCAPQQHLNGKAEFARRCATEAALATLPQDEAIDDMRADLMRIEEMERNATVAACAETGLEVR